MDHGERLFTTVILLPHRLSWTHPFIVCNWSWATQPDDGRCFVQHKEAIMLPLKPRLSACWWCSEPEHHGSINVWPQIYLLVFILGVERQFCWASGLLLWTLSAAVGMFANAAPWESSEGIAPRSVWVWNRDWLETRLFLNAARCFATIAIKSACASTFSKAWLELWH